MKITLIRIIGESWRISLPAKAFSEHLEKSGLRGQSKNLTKLSSSFNANYHHGSMVSTPIPLKLFFQNPFKAGVNDVNGFKMEVIRLQSVDLLKMPSNHQT
jgi:hypothetical protein